MPTKSTKVFARGKVYWAKIVGDQALKQNYDGTGREWSFEFEPEDPSFLKEHRLLDRLKDPLGYANRLEDRGEREKAEKAREAAEGRGDYLVLKKPEFTRDGQKNDPFRIYDENNEPWDDRLIGNGSVVDVKLDIRDWGVGKKKSIYCTAIRVRDLVPYEVDEFAGMDNEYDAPAPKTRKDPPARKAKTKLSGDDLADLDDDIPF